MTLQEFTTSGKYLPPPLRDFHDAKDVFKTIWSSMDLSKFPRQIQDLGWINLHILIIDIFLWWMAKRGWTLQMSRQKVEFLDLEEDIEKYNEELNKELKKFLAARK